MGVNRLIAMAILFTRSQDQQTVLQVTGRTKATHEQAQQLLRRVYIAVNDHMGGLSTVTASKQTFAV